MPIVDITRSFTVRNMTSKEYIELYDHIQRSKPVYIFNTNFVIKDYYPASITTKNKSMFTDLTVNLAFFRPNISCDDLTEIYPYIIDYNTKDENKGSINVFDLNIPLHCLTTKPFNTKAGELLFGKK